MPKEKEVTSASVDIMAQLGGEGDDDLLSAQNNQGKTKQKQTEPPRASDQPIPEGVPEAAEEPRKSVEAAQEPVRRQTPWEKFVNNRSRIFNQIEQETTNWKAATVALEEKLKVDEAAIKQQIENLEAAWPNKKAELAQEVEKQRTNINSQIKDLESAWVQKEPQLKQEAKDHQENTHKQIEEKTKGWLKIKDESNKTVKQHEAAQLYDENNIISLKSKETQLKLQLAGRIVNNIYILIKDEPNLSPAMKQFVNDVAKIREKNPNKVIFTDDNQLQQFKNKMPEFTVDKSPKSALTFYLSNTLNELTQYDVNQYGSNMDKVKNSLGAFTQYAEQAKLYETVPKFSEIDTIEQNRQKVINNINQIKLSDKTIGAVKATLVQQEQAHQKQIVTLQQSIEQAKEKVVTAKQDYETKKADLEQAMAVNLARPAKEEQEYQNTKAKLEADIITGRTQSAQNIQKAKQDYDTQKTKLDTEFDTIDKEYQSVKLQEQKIYQASSESAVKKPVKNNVAVVDQPSEGVKGVAKRVGRSLTNFAKNTKTKAQELGTEIKTKLGEAKEEVSKKLEPVKKGVSELKKTIIKDNHGTPRNWKEIIKEKKNTLINKITRRGRH